ncbi:Cytochrome b5 type B (outer mitochondrial membrane) [Apophysomyces sp. BC1034]|nr:Cytochrome b5 type B (outer mitochondrial membrane) [Apophysomyces sp. BC1021]KAG0188686.1 Cytochrome b5 type B (outer mitochondrial membrane) [Apophysomyces sp. BC1034]
MVTTYTAEDVTKHGNRKDLWVIVHNKVYNVTEFVQEDATEAFEDIGHSDEARDILKKYYIGDLDEKSRKADRTYNTLRAGELPADQTEKKKGSALRVILPALAVVGVLVYKFIIAPQQH